MSWKIDSLSAASTPSAAYKVGTTRPLERTGRKRPVDDVGLNESGSCVAAWTRRSATPARHVSTRGLTVVGSGGDGTAIGYVGVTYVACAAWSTAVAGTLSSAVTGALPRVGWADVNHSAISQSDAS